MSSVPKLLGLSVVLWCFVFAVMCSTSGRKPIAGDSGQMCAAAESLRKRGDFAVEPTRRDVIQGPDGRYYVKYPLLTVLQCVPAMALHERVLAAAPGDESLDMLTPQLVPHVIVATLALGAMHLGLELGLNAAMSVILALILTFTTPVWLGARSLYSETLQATLTIWFMYFALRARDSKRRDAWAALGVVLGLGINTKVTLFVLPVAVVIDQLYERWDRSRVIAAACALPGLLLGAAAWFWYNHVRFGDVMNQGYTTVNDGELGFNVPLASGVYGLLFSSGKSVFQYAPVLLAAVFAVPYFWRERRRDLWLIALPSLFTLCVIGKWWAWSGDWGWGPRLLLPVVPLACLPIVRWLAAPSRTSMVWVGSLAALGLYVQVLGLSVDPSEYLHMVRTPCRVAMGKHPDAPEVRDALLLAHFIPEFNPIVSQHWLLMRHFDQSAANPDGWTPWRTLGVRSWRPKYIPTPEKLNFWVAGTASKRARVLESLFLIASLALAVALVWQLRRAARAERLRARTAQALEPSN
jgi:hypothetical protein